MKWINHKLGELSGLLVALIALSLILGFLSRVMDMPIIWITEFSQFAMVAVIFLGLSLCEQRQGHVRVEVIIIKFPRNGWRAANIFTYLVALVGVGIMLWGCFEEALYSYESLESVSGLVLIPIYPVKFIIVVGIGFYFIQLLINTVRELRSPMPKPTDPDAVIGVDLE